MSGSSWMPYHAPSWAIRYPWTVDSCILAIRKAFRHFEKLPENFQFIADGYSAYVLAAMQFLQEFGEDFHFSNTQALGLTNDEDVSTEFRPFKQLLERLNRSFKQTCRISCGYDNEAGADYNVSLWVAYYNFLRPHQSNGYHVLNQIDILENADNMPGKWSFSSISVNRLS